MKKTHNPYINKQVEDEMHKEKENKAFSIFVKNFFKIDFLREKWLWNLIKDEFDEILKIYGIEDIIDENERSEINNFPREILQKKFAVISQNHLPREYLSKIFNSETILPEYSLFNSISFKKIILLNYITTKSILDDVFLYRKDIESYSFDHLYNILYFYSKGYQNINEMHLLKCQCYKYIDSSPPHARYKKLTEIEPIYKYLSIFKDIYSNYREDTKTLNNLIEVFMSVSLTYQTNEELYPYLPVYFLRDIFGYVLNENLKNICYYSLFYKFLINFKFNPSSYFCDVKDEFKIFSILSSLKNNKYYNLIKKDLLQFANEGKIHAIRDILFDGDEKKSNKYVKGSVIFGVLYGSKKSNTHSGEIDFITKQTDYILDISEGEGEGESKANDTFITFYDFESNKETTVHLKDIIIHSNLTVSYIQDTTLNNEILLTKNAIEVLYKKYPDYFKNVIEKEEDFFYSVYQVMDRRDLYSKFFKRILMRKRGAEDERNEPQDIITDNLLYHVVCFEKVNDFYYTFRPDLIFEELIITENEKEQKILQDMCYFFLDSKKAKILTEENT